MADCRYFIVRHGDEWFIQYENEEFGPYKTQAEATLFAIDAAHLLGERGDIAQVCLMGENGHFRPEWTAGRDSYPPNL